ncbi:hypothetical protein ACFSGX_13620 [Sphingomonas arantia]|uniref:Uncharacterized protein n=1 Tax=Sphingomonas arantia TaxID=1460676 RepID=A0ABW4U3J0_9SPHN
MSNGQTDRAERLAAALRDNLRRRKAQAREIPAAATPEETSAGPPVTDVTE